MDEPDKQSSEVPYRALFEGGKVASAFEQLRQTRQQIDGILQVVVGDDGVLVQDFSGRIAYANGPAATMLGAATPEQLLRMPRDQLLATLVIRDEEGNDHSGELPGTSVLRGAGTSERTGRGRALGQSTRIRDAGRPRAHRFERHRTAGRDERATDGRLPREPSWHR